MSMRGLMGMQMFVFASIVGSHIEVHPPKKLHLKHVKDTTK